MEDSWEESPCIVEWKGGGITWTREVFVEVEFIVIEVVVIAGWDLFYLENEMTREDFLLRKGFECCKF